MRKTDKRRAFCQRVFTFIGGLISPLVYGVGPEPSTKEEKKVQQHHHPPQESSKDDGDDYSGSAIKVHFKQTEDDLQHWTPMDMLGSSVHKDHDQPQFKKLGDNISTSSSTIAEKDDKVTRRRSKVSEPPRNKEIPIVQVNRVTFQQEGRKLLDATGQGKGSIQEKEEINLTPQKILSTKDKASENLTVPLVQPKEASVRYRAHLLSVAPNINEKSDAFIKSRKEAMRRNLDLEPEDQS